jgi:hypothetical protein
MRCYLQPAALLDELPGNRPLKPVRLLGEDLVLFRNDTGVLLLVRVEAVVVGPTEGWQGYWRKTDETRRKASTWASQ